DVLGLETAGAGDRHAVRIAARVESRFALGEHRAAQRGREPEDRARREYQNAPYVQGHTRKPPLASAHISTACAKSGNLFFKSWNSVPMQGSQGSRAAVRGGRDAPPFEFLENGGREVRRDSLRDPRVRIHRLPAVADLEIQSRLAPTAG